jgi:hypothetical protein
MESRSLTNGTGAAYLLRQSRWERQTVCRGNVELCIPEFKNESSSDRCKHLPDDFAVLLPERRGTTPCAYSLLVGLHRTEVYLPGIDRKASMIRLTEEWPTVCEGRPKIVVVSVIRT